VQKSENSIQMANQGFQLELNTARTSFLNSIASLETQKQNRQLATDIARITKLKYEQGVGSSLEVMDAETALKEAETNYFAALFDLYIAKVDLAKASGTLSKK
jgi:outer membrane protein TolC